MKADLATIGPEATLKCVGVSDNAQEDSAHSPFRIDPGCWTESLKERPPVAFSGASPVRVLWQGQAVREDHLGNLPETQCRVVTRYEDVAPLDPVADLRCPGVAGAELDGRVFPFLPYTGRGDRRKPNAAYLRANVSASDPFGVGPVSCPGQKKIRPLRHRRKSSYVPRRAANCSRCDRALVVECHDAVRPDGEPNRLEPRRPEEGIDILHLPPELISRVHPSRCAQHLPAARSRRSPGS